MTLKTDRYITKQVFATALYAVLILTFVLVLGNLFKEINSLLVEKGAPLSFLGIFMLKFLPLSLIYTIPWGIVSASVLVFSRLSSDQEINSLRSAGLSLYRIATPVLILATSLSLLCLYLNTTLAPRSKDELKTLLVETFKNDPLRLLDPGVVQSQMKGQRIYIESKNPDQSLRGLHAYQIDTSDQNRGPRAYIYAKQVAPITPDQKKQKLELRLEGVWAESYDKNGIPQQTFASKIEPWVFPLEVNRKKRLKPNRLDNAEILQLVKNPPPEVPPERIPYYQYERWHRISFSFAPLALCFVGIPLGFTSKRKKTSSGAGWSLFIAVAYFLFFTMADELRGESMITSYVLLALPNLFCLAFGILLFSRANKRA